LKGSASGQSTRSSEEQETKNRDGGGEDRFMNENIGLGLFLSILFWIVAVSVVVVVAVWATFVVGVRAVAEWFPKKVHNVRKSMRMEGEREVSPRPAPPEENAGEPYRKAS
jgi:cytoskeletal protein RodZ